MNEDDVKWIVDNWDKIDTKYKVSIKPNHYERNKGEYVPYGPDVVGLEKESHVVVMLLDRQKPSIVSCYDFDEERIGVTQKGQIIWGFDSGCSCPSPWYDSYPKCYNVSKTWKEFELEIKTTAPGEFTRYGSFDVDWNKEADEAIQQLKKSLE